MSNLCRSRAGEPQRHGRNFLDVALCMDLVPERTIYFDGGAAPNPGPIIVAVVHGDHRLLLRLDGIDGGNNEAEFRAALAALDYAVAAGMRQLVLAGDSDAVIAALGSRRPPKPGKLTWLYHACVASADVLGDVTWRRVPRTNPAGRLIQAERRVEKAVRRSARPRSPHRLSAEPDP